MGMSTHVVGFKPPDDKFNKMKAVWEACTVAGVDPPQEVRDFFDDEFGEEPPDPSGVRVNLGTSPAVRPWGGASQEGLEIDLRKLDPDIKILRFYNSY